MCLCYVAYCICCGQQAFFLSGWVGEDGGTLWRSVQTQLPMGRMGRASSLGLVVYYISGFGDRLGWGGVWIGPDRMHEFAIVSSPTG